jgi:hypothetical protein
MAFARPDLHHDPTGSAFDPPPLGAVARFGLVTGIVALIAVTLGAAYLWVVRGPVLAFDAALAFCL